MKHYDFLYLFCLIICNGHKVNRNFPPDLWHLDRMLCIFYGNRLIDGFKDPFQISDIIDKIVEIGQDPIGRTPRSNPATYTGVFDDIRDLFAQTKEAKMLGYDKGRFSFNVKGGRCEACQGDGILRISMHFLPDVYVPCEECH